MRPLSGLGAKLGPFGKALVVSEGDELWPKLGEALRSCGVSMLIYRHEDTLFLHQRAPSKEAFQRMGAHPVAPRWNKYMADVLQTNERGEIIFIALPLAPAFGEFS